MKKPRYSALIRSKPFWFIVLFWMIAAVVALTFYKRGSAISYELWSGPVTECFNDAEDKDFTNCGQVDEKGVFHINKALLPKLATIHDGLACFHLGNTLKVFYVNKETGRTLESYGIDMGCDYFSEGLARSPSPQGTRFFDRSLNVIISTPYHYAFPFEKGYAIVCNDLRVFYPFYDEDNYGEYVGGYCGYINKQGTLAVPLDYSYSEVGLHAP